MRCAGRAARPVDPVRDAWQERHLGTTPGNNDTWGGFGGLGLEFRYANVAVFGSAEYLALSDDSHVVSGRAVCGLCSEVGFPETEPARRDFAYGFLLMRT